MAGPPEGLGAGPRSATSEEAEQLASDALLGPRAKGIAPRRQVESELRRTAPRAAVPLNLTPQAAEAGGLELSVGRPALASVEKRGELASVMGSSW
jgi:hypothetical protein